MGGNATSPSWRPRARTQPRPQPGSSHWRSTSRFTRQPVRIGSAAHHCQSPRGHSQSPWFDGAQLESRRSAAEVLEVVRFFTSGFSVPCPSRNGFWRFGGDRHCDPSQEEGFTTKLGGQGPLVFAVKRVNGVPYAPRRTHGHSPPAWHSRSRPK